MTLEELANGAPATEPDDEGDRGARAGPGGREAGAGERAGDSEARRQALDPQRLGRAEAALGVAFRDRTLLAQALIHRSYVNEHPDLGLQPNERLEFLGDAVIGLIVAHLLFDRLPEASEGDLTLLRATLVRESTLADWARQVDLGRFLLVGLGEERAGVRERDPLLARTFEAVAGALYLDQGFATAWEFVARFAARELEAEGLEWRALDAKSRLQQLAQSVYNVTPTYRVIQVSGPGHRPHFTVEVQAGPGLVATGEGATKQAAQQAAARVALARLEEAIATGAGVLRESRRAVRRRGRSRRSDVRLAERRAAPGAEGETARDGAHLPDATPAEGRAEDRATEPAADQPRRRRRPAAPGEEQAANGARPRQRRQRATAGQPRGAGSDDAPPQA